ncbi:MFS transporter [Tsukamurella soli]
MPDPEPPAPLSGSALPIDHRARLQPGIIQPRALQPGTADVPIPEHLAAASAQPAPVGRLFVTLYALAYMGTWLALMCPVLVTLSLKMTALVGSDRAPGQLALVTGTGALLAMFGNPLFGSLSDRTTSQFGMRRPWMLIGFAGGLVGIVIVAVAPTVPVALVGWCITQLMFNAVLATQTAVLPDHVPAKQRGTVSGILGICMPIALVIGSYIVQLFSPDQFLMFVVPTVIAAIPVIAFAVLLKDRRLAPADRIPFSAKEFASSFYVNPLANRDFSWAFVSRFLFILAYSFLTTYQTFYLIHRVGVGADDVAHVVFLGTLANSTVWIVLSLVGGPLSDRLRRRKPFVLTASAVYGIALVVLAVATHQNGYLIAMTIAGLGMGVYMAVDLALVTDVLPDTEHAAKDLGVFNIASALPQSIAPAIAPAILAVGGRSYSFLYAVAAVVAVLGALAVLRVRSVH